MTNQIKLTYTDNEINDLLGSISGDHEALTRHYNQVEEFFLIIRENFSVPRLPIHHDIREPRPEQEYLARLKEVLNQIIPLAPQVFMDLTYIFDPAEILRPCFFKLYRIEDCQYLYLLRLDLTYRPQVHTILEKGNNDFTAYYSTRSLFMEANFIPLDRVTVNTGKINDFLIKQTISNTWVDETGRGYFVQGIWIDNELTKFFSKLFLPPGKKTYPFYPYICKYKTICHSLIHFSPESRKLYLPNLHKALNFLIPFMEEIETSMKNVNFSVENDTYKRLKQNVPESWCEIWKNLEVEVYLNEQDMREFIIED